MPQQEMGFLGQHNQLVSGQFALRKKSLRFTSRQELRHWQKTAQDTIKNLLAYNPPPTPLNATEKLLFHSGNVAVSLVTYQMPYGTKTEGLLLRPENGSGKLPAVLALHCHGAFKYYGKEKLVEMPCEPEILTRYRRKYYEQKSWPLELAKRGYVVFVPDLFLWGSRKLTLRDMGIKKDSPSVLSDEEIQKYNKIASAYESVVEKSLFLAGTTWTGIMLYEDRRALEYLCGRPDVDPEKVGCGGLSGGGLRTIFLCGFEPRVKCGFTAGFMATFESLLQYTVPSHTWMMYVPGLPEVADMPDVAALGGKPFFALFNKQDKLWHPDGQRKADEKLQWWYGQMGKNQDYVGRYYDGGHKFDAKMQQDVFSWLDTRLKPGHNLLSPDATKNTK